MPLALYVLALAVFAQGTSEFMLSGLVPDLARDLGVSVSAAGSLTSAFAAGMIVGAPLMAVAGMRWPRRRALTAFLVVFVLVHVVGAVTDDFGVLLVTRVLAAVANAGFLAVGLAAAVAMVPPDAKGRATSVLLGGVTLACVAGVPGGAVLGQAFGWRAAFWAVALACLPALYAVLRSIPATPEKDAPARSAGGEVRVLRESRVVVVLVLAALVNAATFCVFTYLAPLVTEVAGLAAGWVPAVLALFGLGSFAGVSVAGRLSDTRPAQLLAGGGIALLAGWALLAATAGNPVAAVLLAFVQGALAFAVGSALIARALYAASGAPSLGGSFATAALNVGAAVGPALGGLALAAGLGHRSPAWAAVVLVAAALLVGVLARRTLFTSAGDHSSDLRV
ncbi:Cmx/CmrA family chloramphenicol efflux MFS transporter [Nonomuraea sp. LP-02]|uniref:Cmx/CmrA family chloramphenicol efflux MFS transporter n=1 Tax=Nonomuraea sp. LP-02 TaxID=3097960 RepID=UPI002E311E37|nr:Cmx/CmrA family chloramphenicol efflux MFS transporter [Nonomuraea sp. LP-02]MED7923167.1 Cmx/CmrA family chloramphenicol efflux MFS transporter [Nonomuraea sp. LP-02]